MTVPSTGPTTGPMTVGTALSAGSDHPPFPFFVGCGRSGTTLLRAMFDAHRDMAVPDEVAFIIRYARPHYALQYGWPRRFDAARCADLIVADPSFRRWPITETEVRAALTDAVPTSFADTIRRLYSLAAARSGKPRYADKTPMHVLHLRRLGRLFAEARFVHVVRDGRDVAMSYRSVGWGPTTVEDAAVRWRRSVLRGRRDGERLGPSRYREVRYEELVADPERVLRELCGFLDLDWDEGVLHHHERAAGVIAATRFPDAHGRLLLPPTPGLRDWRREMAAADVARFEAVAGELLDELGYGCGAPPPSARRRATARCRLVADGASRSWVQVVAGASRRRPTGRPPMTTSSVADFDVRRYEPDDEAVVLDLLGASLGWQPDELHARLFAWKHHENAFGVSPAWVATVGRPRCRLSHVHALGVRHRRSASEGGASGRHGHPSGPSGPRRVRRPDPARPRRAARRRGGVRVQHARTTAAAPATWRWGGDRFAGWPCSLAPARCSHSAGSPALGPPPTSGPCPAPWACRPPRRSPTPA